MIRILIAALGLATLAIGCQQTKDTHSNQTALEQLFSDISIYESTVRPEDSLGRSIHLKGSFGSRRWPIIKAHKDSLAQFLNRLNAFEKKSLSEQEKISQSIMRLKLRNSISQVEYKNVLIPFNAEGGFYNRLSYSLPNLPFDTPEDYRAYLHWLPKYASYIKENKLLMEQGIEEGIVAPKSIVNNTIQLMSRWAPDTLTNSIFYQPFHQLDFDSTINHTLRQEAKVVISNTVLVAYKELLQFVKTGYLKAAYDEPGINNIPNGDEYYKNRVAHYTTLENITPDSVHRLGLTEVKRIRKAMDKIIADVEFDGSFGDFLGFLRTDPQFYPKTGQQLLNYAAWLSKKAEGELPRFFKKLYSLPFTVASVPEDIAPTYTGGRYVGGSWQRQTPGTYWVNTYRLNSRTLYTLPSLTLHEAVPGHHLQNALAAELEDLPPFRNSYYISAFGEGWGLYSEFLGEEMGMYSTPYELFGRYTYEMWRACRLVVDTGIHSKGWSRDQAVDYMAGNTALSLHEVNTEIDRYIGWPGQALSYKIGELKIRSLRQKASEELGESFDIREFHDVILRNGSVPLGVLDEQVAKYINNIKNE